MGKFAQYTSLPEKVASRIPSAGAVQDMDGNLGEFQTVLATPHADDVAVVLLPNGETYLLLPHPNIPRDACFEQKTIYMIVLTMNGTDLSRFCSVGGCIDSHTACLAKVSFILA